MRGGVTEVTAVEVIGEQAVHVVERRTQLLPAGDVLERRRYTPLRRQLCGVDRDGHPETGQRGAAGAQQRDGFEHVSLSLQQCLRGEVRVVERPLSHDA